MFTDLPRTLLFCAAGARMATLSWLPGMTQQPGFEIGIAHYGAELAPAPAGVHYDVRNRDFKVPNFLQLLREHPQALDCDFFLFIDDDIVASPEDLVRWLGHMRDMGLDISQPSVTRDSKADWPHLHHQPGLVPVDRDQFVEIQCFALTRRALQLALPYFFMVKTGAGLDLALYRLARRHGLRSGVVHAVQVLHPHRPEGETVRQQFSRFGDFNAQMDRFMTFCFGNEVAFDDLVTASRVLGDTRPRTVRWVSVLRFWATRITRVLGRKYRTARHEG